MSFVIALPQSLTAAAGRPQVIGSAIGTANLNAALPTTGVVSAAADEVSFAPLPISAASAKRRQLAGAVLLDIRPQVARHQGSITDADVIEPAELTESSLPIAQDRDRDIIVCSISSKRAIPTAELLTRHGYRHVYYLAGGYTAWRNRHGDRRLAPAATPPDTSAPATRTPPRNPRSHHGDLGADHLAVARGVNPPDDPYTTRSA